MKAKMNRFLFWLALGMLCDGSAWAQAQALKLVVLQPLDSPKVLAIKATLDLAFARSGMRYTLAYNPGERAIVAFRDGSFDGDANRLSTFNQTFPDAIRVEPHLNGAFFYAMSASKAARPVSWADLSRFSVAYVRGYRGIEIRLAQVAVREPTDSEDACLKMAAGKRVDLCILASDRFGEWPLQAQFGDRLNGTLFDQTKVHAWMGPQHKEAADRLTKVLREMDKTGELQRIMALYRQPD